MGLTIAEKESISHELAIFLDADHAGSSATVDWATEIVVASRKSKGAKEKEVVKAVYTINFNGGSPDSDIHKVVKMYLYNGRNKQGSPLKAAEKHKESALRL